MMRRISLSIIWILVIIAGFGVGDVFGMFTLLTTGVLLGLITRR